MSIPGPAVWARFSAAPARRREGRLWNRRQSWEGARWQSVTSDRCVCRRFGFVRRLDPPSILEFDLRAAYSRSHRRRRTTTRPRDCQGSRLASPPASTTTWAPCATVTLPSCAPCMTRRRPGATHGCSLGSFRATLRSRDPWRRRNQSLNDAVDHRIFADHDRIADDSSDVPHTGKTRRRGRLHCSLGRSRVGLALSGRGSRPSAGTATTPAGRTWRAREGSNTVCETAERAGRGQLLNGTSSSGPIISTVGACQAR